MAQTQLWSGGQSMDPWNSQAGRPWAGGGGPRPSAPGWSPPEATPETQASRGALFADEFGENAQASLPKQSPPKPAPDPDLDQKYPPILPPDDSPDVTDDPAGDENFVCDEESEQCLA